MSLRKKQKITKYGLFCECGKGKIFQVHYFYPCVEICMWEIGAIASKDRVLLQAILS